MLMLYLFHLDLTDLERNYTFSTAWALIAETKADRQARLRSEFGERFELEVKRAVLVGARALTCAETLALTTAIKTGRPLWFSTRVPASLGWQPVRHLPRLATEEVIRAMKKRSTGRFDSFSVTPSRCTRSFGFSMSGTFRSQPLVAA